MSIEYNEAQNISAKELEKLFLSAKWSSGYYPDRMAAASRNFGTVYTAWDGEKLVGLICATDDGITTAYIHYLLVLPEYRKFGIGKRLVEMIKEKYKDYYRIVLVSAHQEETRLYKACGFKKADGSNSMFFTSLWT